MKQLLILVLSAATVLTACKQQRYYDLTAGDYIKLEKDSSTGKMVNAETHQPVYMYVDTKTKDTIYGATGEVINGHVVATGDGKYRYDGDNAYKMPDEDYKKKMDEGEVKIKTDDGKIKTDDEGRKVKD